MKKFAFIFPGQGAQKVGMGMDLYQSSPAAKKVFETANEILGYDIAELCFNGSEDELMKTINSQPCILTVSLAAIEALREQININPVCCAGHSLGEYAALYVSGAIDLKTVLTLIQKRADLMNKAAESTKGGMAAVLGLDDETVIKITKNLSNVYVANFNSPGQVVITGDKDEINKSLDLFKEAGAKRVIPLAVSGAFHSPLMVDAGKEFSVFVNQYEFKNVEIPVFTNVDAKPTVVGEELKNKLPMQISSSVLWTQTINKIAQEYTANFIEIGPGKVLAGLNKKISSELNTLNIYDFESLNSVVAEIKEKELV
ncbi:TPA: ACP S-malonyltransferase [Candidatus Avigastranaerophilus faecigallinarum]|nr:ACP S-malonyltransferase [Candidatus Avigastranaerophilus faecigallinarum]